MSDAIAKAELLVCFESDQGVLVNALQVYKKDLFQLLSQMRTAFTHHYIANIVDAAHTLNRLFCYLSAHSAVEAALKLETIICRNKLSSAENVIAVLDIDSFLMIVAHSKSAAELTRISHQMDESSLALWTHKNFSSVGNTAHIPLLHYAFLLCSHVRPEPFLVRAFDTVCLTLQKIPSEFKPLRDHLAHW